MLKEKRVNSIDGVIYNEKHSLRRFFAQQRTLFDKRHKKENTV